MARVCPPDRISRMLLHTRVQIVSKNLSVEAQDVFSVKLFYVGFYDLKREILSFLMPTLCNFIYESKGRYE